MVERCTEIWSLGIPLILMANLLLPAAHEMWHLEIPIHSLPVEIASWRNTPPEIRTGKLLHEGRLLVHQGRFDEALADFDAVIAIEPRYTEAFADRAALRLELGDHAGAGQDLATALQRNPDDPRSLFLHGMLNVALGDSSGAVNDLRKALQSPKPWPQRAVAERFLEEITRGPQRK